MSCRTFVASMLWATLLVAPGAYAQAPTRVSVTFGHLPGEWTVQQNPMDAIWQPLGMRGVNYYAFGGPVPPKTFAARSDPASTLYQAWLGAYVVIDALDSASGNDEARQRDLLSHLTEYDQRGWLAAMGDPAPVAELVGELRRSQIVIDGEVRALFTGDMRSHSDLHVATTPLAQSLGMPPITSWQDQLAPFHDVVLHVQGAAWYDTARHVTVVVYAASSAFTTTAGVMHNNGPVLNDSLRSLMRRAHVVDGAAAGQR